MTEPTPWRRYPTVYEINTRVWLSELSRRHRMRIDLGNVPDEEIDRLESFALDGVWMMGVWAPSPASRRIALGHPGLGPYLARALPDLREEDVVGSPFAVYAYRISQELGGESGLRRFREQLTRRSMRLMLDFVPNHLAVDHHWTESRPELLVACGRGGRSSDQGGPRGDECFTRIVEGERRRFAHGRDPYFAPWTDTVQIDYGRPETHAAMIAILRTIAERCDGVRCDMAMLVTSEVFRRVWGAPQQANARCSDEFWEKAIETVKAHHPGFLFLAEVYWDMERELQHQGFDYTYDKKLYDRLRSGDGAAVRAHLQQNDAYQPRAARFIENHDEERAVTALGRSGSRAAALLIASLPGLRLFHQGQFEGRTVRQPVQLNRLPPETPDTELARFYRRLLQATSRPVFHDGTWELLTPRQAWPGNGSHRSIVAYTWHVPGGDRALIAVNLGEDRSQGFVPLSWPGLAESSWRLRELVDEGDEGPIVYQREGDALESRGLYVDLGAHAHHFLLVEPVAGG